jgi:hypothetical protein
MKAHVAWIGGIFASVFLIFGFLVIEGRNVMAEPAAAESQLAHMVYFTLNDSTPEARQKLVKSCHKYLSDHPGTVYFSVGTLVPDLARPVNDRDYDVALNVVFKTRADHDRYQTAERHQKFIEENKPTWKRVRVFDSYLQ